MEKEALKNKLIKQVISSCVSPNSIIISSFIKAIFPALLGPTAAQTVVRFAMDDLEIGRVSHRLCH